MKNNKGLTLIEVIVVITMIVMLAAIIIPIIDRNIKDMDDFVDESIIEKIENAAYIYAITYESEIPNLKSNNMAKINLQTLYDKGLLDTIKLNNISLNDEVLIVNINNNLETIYDKKQENNPIIFLHGPKEVTLKRNSNYEELGAAVINYSLNSITELDSSNIDSASLSTSNVGTYYVHYTYSNADEKIRTVYIVNSDNVTDDTKPVINLEGPSTITISQGSTFVDPGFEAIDANEGNISNRVLVTGSVNIYEKGTYYIRYDVTNLYGNKAETQIRTVIVN